MNFHAYEKRGGENGCQSVVSYSVIVLSLVGLYFTTFINYLIFHSLAEIFSIVVAFSIFVIAWNSKKYIRNPYLLFIGIAYFFIAFIDLIHTLAYKGMPLFTDTYYYATQLWIGARYMESVTLFIAFFFMKRNRLPNEYLIFVSYSVIAAILIASVFFWKNFPECFVEGEGLTPFKKISEYLICAILFAAIFLLHKNKERFERRTFWIIFSSIICTIISEASFTLYVDTYGLSNLIGHYFKIFSFLLIYEVIIKTGIEKPFELIFLDLDKVNAGLKDEIQIRLKTEEEKEQLINSLKIALKEIKTLRGLLPMCSICKKIRDDSGYWESIESYFVKHSELEFSHGICPNCAKKHYSDFYPPEK